MRSKLSDPPAAHSMDTTWYAIDRDGCVAEFYSGEDGAVPRQIGRDQTLLNNILNGIPPLFAEDTAKTELRQDTRDAALALETVRIALQKPSIDIQLDEAEWPVSSVFCRNREDSALFSQCVVEVLEDNAAEEIIRESASLKVSLIRKVRIANALLVLMHGPSIALIRRIAERGLFARLWPSRYQSRLLLPRYQYMCSPLSYYGLMPYLKEEIDKKAARYDQLPPIMQARIRTAGLAQMPSVSFDESYLIQPMEHFECGHRGLSAWFDPREFRLHPEPGDEDDFWDQLGDLLHEFGKAGPPRTSEQVLALRPPQPAGEIRWLGADGQGRVAMFHEHYSCGAVPKNASCRVEPALLLPSLAATSMAGVAAHLIAHGHRMQSSFVSFHSPGLYLIRFLTSPAALVGLRHLESLKADGELVEFGVFEFEGGVCALVGESAKKWEWNEDDPYWRDNKPPPIPAESDCWEVPLSHQHLLGLYSYFGQSGLYGGAVCEPYRRGQAPNSPLCLTAIPEEIRSRIPVLENANFDRDESIQPMECIDAAQFALGWIDAERRRLRPMPGAEDSYAYYFDLIKKRAPEGMLVEPPSENHSAKGVR